GANRHFHHPFCHFGRKPVLQTNGLLGLVSVFGRFWGYQILPNFTNSYQKCVAKGVRRGSKRQSTGVFLRAIYLNRVKSGGSCQAVSGALPCWFPAVFGKKGAEGFNRMMKMSISGTSEDWGRKGGALSRQCVDSNIFVSQLAQPKK
ncbi:MAG: hypothetical protein ACLQOO_08805, partial [Terriglobia bacterium]